MFKKITFLSLITFSLIFIISLSYAINVPLSYEGDVSRYLDKYDNLFDKIVGEFYNFFLRTKEFIKAQILPPQEEVKFEKIGRLVLPNGNASGIEKYGNYVYVVLNETSKSPLVFDVSDPNNPKLVNMVPAQGWPTRIRMVEGTKWLWAVHGNTWAFYDLTDPANPRLAGPDEGPKVKFINRGADNPPYSFLQHPNLTYRSVASENILVYGRGDAQKNIWAEIYDISDPKNPKFLSKIENAEPKVLRGNILLVSGYAPQGQEAGVQIRAYDISDPSNPILLTTLHTPRSLVYQLFTFNDAMDYDPINKRLYVATGRVRIKLFGIETFDPRLGRTSSGIAVFDVSDWSNPVFLGHNYFPDYNNATYISNVDWIVYNNGLVFGADIYYGLRIYDVRDPQNIKYVSGYKVGGEVSGIAIVPERNLVLLNQNLQGGLIFVDVSDPSNPRELNNIPHGFANWGGNYVYQNRYLYFPGGRRYIASGLFIVNFQDVFNPIVKFLSDYLACTFLGESGYCISHDHIGYTYTLDIKKDPMNPVKIAKSYEGVIPQIIKDSKYYRDNTYLSVIGYKEPLLFVLNTKDGGGLRDINDTNKRLGATLYILDTTDKSKFKLLGSLDILAGPIHRVVTSAIIGDKLFISWWGKLVVVDFSDTNNPKLVGMWEPGSLGLPSHYTHIWSDGDYLFVGSYRNTLAAYDVSDLTKGPRLVGKIDGVCTSWVMDGDPQKQLIYRTCLDGLQIIKYTKLVQSQPELTQKSNKSPYTPFVLSPINNSVFYASTSLKITFNLRLEDPDKDDVKTIIEVYDANNNLIFSKESDFVKSGSSVSIEKEFSIGDYKWRAKSVDKNNNESSWISYYTFSIQTPPEAKPINNPPDISLAGIEPIVEGNMKKGVVNSSTIRLYIGVKDPEGEPVTVKVDLVNSSTNQVDYSTTVDYGTATHKYVYVNNIAPGTYIIKVYATDSSGNTKKFPHFEPIITVPEQVASNNAPKVTLFRLTDERIKVEGPKEISRETGNCIKTRTPTFEIQAVDPEGDDLTYTIIIRDNQYPWATYRDMKIPVPGTYKSGEKVTFTIPQEYSLHPVGWNYRVWVQASDGKLLSELKEERGFFICNKDKNNKPNPPEIIFPPDDYIFRKFIPTATTVLRENLIIQMRGTDPDPEDTTLRFKVVATEQEEGISYWQDQTQGKGAKAPRGWGVNWYKQGEVANFDTEWAGIFPKPGRYKVEVYAHDGWEWSEPTTIWITVF